MIPKVTRQLLPHHLPTNDFCINSTGLGLTVALNEFQFTYVCSTGRLFELLNNPEDVTTGLFGSTSGYYKLHLEHEPFKQSDMIT